MTSERRRSLWIALALSPLLLCGGCIGLVLWKIGQPPSGDIWRPLPDGVQLVDDRAWCDEAEAPAEWNDAFRDGMCVRELRVRKAGMPSSDLAKELNAHYQSVFYFSVDIQRFVTVSESDPTLVNLVNAVGL